MKAALILTLLVAVSSKKTVVATEGETQTASESLSDLITQAQNNINALAKQMQEQLSLPDQETLVNNLKTQSANFVSNVQAYVSNVTEEVKSKSPEFEKMWSDVKEKLNKVVDDINAQIPHAKEQAEQLQAKFQEGMQTLLQESEKAAKTIGENSEKLNQDIGKLTKQAVDIVMQTTSGVQKAVSGDKN